MTDRPKSADVNQLMQEFKFHLIYRNRPKHTNQAIDRYKQLLSQLQEHNHHQRKNRRKMTQTQKTPLKQSRPSISTVQSRIWWPKPIEEGALEEVTHRGMMVEKQKAELQYQIKNLEAEVMEANRKVAEIKKQVQVISKSQEKYKHITHLAKSIQRTTQSTKNINTKSFLKLVKYQDDVLNNLKKFRVDLRKENQEGQSRLLLANKQLQSRVKKVPQVKKKFEEEDRVVMGRQFINKINELLRLFRLNQPGFQDLKAELTTKVRMKKINVLYLKDERAKLHSSIQQFQKQNDVKVESLANLVVHIYHKLITENKEIEDQCIQCNHMRDALLQELKRTQPSNRVSRESNSSCEGERCRLPTYRIDSLRNNSQTSMKTLVLFHQLLGKFNYLFTMALTLNVQKKHFNDLLQQLATVYHNDQLFIKQQVECKGIDDKAITAKQLTSFWREHGDERVMDQKEIVDFIFSDIRIPLMFTHKRIEEELRDGLITGDVVNSLEKIVNRCDQTFDHTFKHYTFVLLNSLKALNLNKYEKKMVANSNAIESLFLSHSKPRCLVDTDECFETPPADARPSQTSSNNLVYEPVQSQPKQQFSTDPRSIVNNLERLKNHEKKDFKPFVFEPEQIYMYGTKDVVLPRYALE